VAVEVISWRVQVAGPPPALELRHDDPGPAAGDAAPDGAAAIKGERRVYFPETEGFTATPVYDRYRLRPGARFRGPAVVEERESTAVVGPGAAVAVDAGRNLVITRPEGPAEGRGA
jgi:N-methylhydantoinase A